MSRFLPISLPISLAQVQHTVPGYGWAGVWKVSLVLLCIALTAGVTYAVLHFFILSRIPREMVGTWVVMDVKTTADARADESLKGGTLEFRSDGTMIGRVNMDGKEGMIQATVEVEGGGKATLFVNDAQVAEGKIEQTVPFAFSADETVDVGFDDATPVTEDYVAGHASRFNGRIRRVTIELK